MWITHNLCLTIAVALIKYWPNNNQTSQQRNEYINKVKYAFLARLSSVQNNKCRGKVAGNGVHHIKVNVIQAY